MIRGFIKERIGKNRNKEEDKNKDQKPENRSTIAMDDLLTGKDEEIFGQAPRTSQMRMGREVVVNPNEFQPAQNRTNNRRGGNMISGSADNDFIAELMRSNNDLNEESKDEDEDDFDTMFNRAREARQSNHLAVPRQNVKKGASPNRKSWVMDDQEEFKDTPKTQSKPVSQQITQQQPKVNAVQPPPKVNPVQPPPKIKPVQPPPTVKPVQAPSSSSSQQQTLKQKEEADKKAREDAEVLKMIEDANRKMREQEEQQAQWRIEQKQRKAAEEEAAKIKAEQKAKEDAARKLKEDQERREKRKNEEKLKKEQQKLLEQQKLDEQLAIAALKSQEILNNSNRGSISQKINIVSQVSSRPSNASGTILEKQDSYDPLKRSDTNTTVEPEGHIDAVSLEADEEFFNQQLQPKRNTIQTSQADQSTPVVKTKIEEVREDFGPLRRESKKVDMNQSVDAYQTERRFSNMDEARIQANQKQQRKQTTLAKERSNAVAFIPPYQEESFKPPFLSEEQVEGEFDFHDRLQKFQSRERNQSSFFTNNTREAKELRMANYDSSEQNLTDEEGFNNCNIDSEEVELYMQLPVSLRKNQVDLSDIQKKLEELAESKLKEDDSSEPEEADLMQSTYISAQPLQKGAQDADFIQIIDKNESKSREIALEWNKNEEVQRLRKMVSNNLTDSRNKASSQTVISPPVTQDLTCRNFTNKNTVVTCCCLNENLMLVGTSAGMLYAYDIKTQHAYGVHKEDGKEFVDNPITSIDVHQRRPNYVVYGHARGQIVILDLLKITKNIKCIKGHQTKQIVSIKFVDWTAEKPHFMQEVDPNHKCKECQDVKKFMFISVDIEGKVVQSTVEDFKIYFHANDNVFFDPAKEPCLLWHTLAPRMSSSLYPSEHKEDDFAEIVAAGSPEGIAIWYTPEKRRLDIRSYPKPQRYYSENRKEVCPIRQQLPILCWGFGQTPTYNWKPFPLLAVAWGPLIQIYVYQNYEGDSSKNEDFDLAGHYIIASARIKDEKDDLDIYVESMQFIDQGLLFIVTSNKEVRVLKTEMFRPEAFQEPKQFEDSKDIEWDKIDPRSKMTENGTILDRRQKCVELERIQSLPQKVWKSMGGNSASQTVSVFGDKAIAYTEQGLQLLTHLTWFSSLGDIKTTDNEQDWVKVFKKAQKIYNGKLTGFRIQSREQMREQLKQLINKQVTTILENTKVRIKQNPNEKDKQSERLMAFIRVLIDFCVDVRQPLYLFSELLQKFEEHNYNKNLCDELRSYILAGIYSELQIEEKILKTVLKNFQDIHLSSLGLCSKSVPKWMQTTHNFEKILLSFRLEHCSKEYKQELLSFCRQHKMSTAIASLLLQMFGFDHQNGTADGPIQALCQLKDFYQQAKPESGINLEQLVTLEADSPVRIQIENSQQYIGHKLLWTARQFLLGSKVPRGKFTSNEWRLVCHDVTELLTQDEFIQILTNIDAQAYFQIISIVFNNPSHPYTYISENRQIKSVPVVQETNLTVEQQTEQDLESRESREDSTSSTITDPQPQTSKKQMTHLVLIQRIRDFYQKHGEKHPSYTHYLCFIAETCKDSEIQDEQLLYDVLLHLLKNSEAFTQFNKGILLRQMAEDNMYRRLNQQGVTVSDELKHLVMTERSFIRLAEKCKSMLQTYKFIKPVLDAVRKTEFYNLKLVLHELNQDYLRCLKLFINFKQSKMTGEKLRIQEVLRSQSNMAADADGFEWISAQHLKLQRHVKDNRTDQSAKHQLEAYEKEVLAYGQSLLTKDIRATIRLFDTSFRTAHQKMLDSMQEDTKMQLYYILKLLEFKKEQVKELFTAGGASGDKHATVVRDDERKMWTSIFKLHVRLLCTHAPQSVTVQVRQIIKDNFYPMDECLKIVTEFKKMEAMALLNKKIGNNREAVRLLTQLLKDQLCENDLKKELFHFNKECKRHRETRKSQIRAENRERFAKGLAEEGVEGERICITLLQGCISNMIYHMARYQTNPNLLKVWAEKHGPNIDLFETTHQKVTKILAKNPQECLVSQGGIWREYLEILFNIRFHPAVNRKHYCKSYIREKITSFCLKIVQYVTFEKIMGAIQSFKTNLRFKAIKELVNVVFTDKTNEDEMCKKAFNNQNRDIKDLLKANLSSQQVGILFLEQALRCGICDASIHAPGKKLFRDNFLIFDCKPRILAQYSDDLSNVEWDKVYNHCFHTRCLRIFIEQEQERDKSKKEKLTNQDIARLTRCPICFSNNEYIQLENKSRSNVQHDKDQEETQDTGSQHQQQWSSSAHKSQGDLEERKRREREKAMFQFDKMQEENTCSLHAFSQI